MGASVVGENTQLCDPWLVCILDWEQGYSHCDSMTLIKSVYLTVFYYWCYHVNIVSPLVRPVARVAIAKDHDQQHIIK